ncbi:MAG: DUF1553 domain-containing protein [Planctomycetes bacterium]|nr:DUF1553 domain-containing protein [Planctomycetota bacterium]
MTTCLVLAFLLAGAPVGADVERGLVRPFEGSAEVTPEGRIDELVFGKLEELGIRPANVCSDGVFLRRAYLDAIGTLPTTAEARRFLRDRSPKKRSELVDRLLTRDEFADYWTMKWGDLLRVKAEFPINLWPNGVQAYDRWIRTSIRENMPYDQFARELLTSSGSNFRVPQVNYYRAMESQEPEVIAQAVALALMGERAEKWPEERLAGMAVFFSRIGFKETSEWKEQIVFFDSLKKAANGDGASAKAVFPDGTPAELPSGVDPRVVFSDWLIRAENPSFQRNIVNRIWYWLLGRGIIHEPDDIRADNPARNPELLAWLERELAASDYDLRHIYRLILNSKTYQLSSIPKTDHPEGEAHFAYYPTRRLDAEVLIDALCQVTGTTEEYSSAVPEPFAFIPENQRSIALADGSTTSSFLEMFGRPARDTGLVSERDNRFTAAQRLHLLNSTHIQRKIAESQTYRRSSRSWASGKPLEIVTEVYLRVLSRFPTEGELETLREYAESGAVDRAAVLVDLEWALVNSAEFLYRH